MRARGVRRGHTVARDSWIFMCTAQPTVERGLRSSSPEHTSSIKDVLPTPESPSTKMRTLSAFFMLSDMPRSGLSFVYESFHELLDKMGSNPKESKKKDKTKKHKNKKVDLPLSGLARARAGFASFAGLACSRAGPAICRRRHAAHRARGKWRASKS
jgi:hypothetical protein